MDPGPQPIPPPPPNRNHTEPAGKRERNGDRTGTEPPGWAAWRAVSASMAWSGRGRRRAQAEVSVFLGDRQLLVRWFCIGIQC